jgi:hypothetical protein
LHGRAQALPDALPLVSPGGERCLWFRRADHALPRTHVTGSMRPFLLVDDSGQCIVLPAGAEVTGGERSEASPVSDEPGDATGSDASRTTERLLRDGDRIQVVGRFVVASPEALALQSCAATHVGRAQGAPAALRVAADSGFAFAPAPPWAGTALALPVMVAPGSLQPLVIDIVSDDAGTGLYGVLAVIDALVLVAAAGLSVWAVLAAR